MKELFDVVACYVQHCFHLVQIVWEKPYLFHIAFLLDWMILAALVYVNILIFVDIINKLKAWRNARRLVAEQRKRQDQLFIPEKVKERMRQLGYKAGDVDDKYKMETCEFLPYVLCYNNVVHPVAVVNECIVRKVYCS